MNLKFLIVLTISCSFFSCSNNSTDDLTEPPAEIISYNKDIAPIISSNCIFCHTNPPVNGAPMSLSTYDNVKDAIKTRGLLDRISRAQGAPGMMPNGGMKLPQSSIDKIIKWQTDGFIQ